MKKKKEKFDWYGMFGHMSLMATIWLFLLAVVMPSVADEHIIVQIIVFTLTVFGGVMLYIPIAVKLEEIKKKYGKKTRK